MAEALRLAQRLGGEAVTLPGQDVAETVIEYARANNVTHIIVVQSPRSRWRDMLFGTDGAAADPQGGGANVHVIEPAAPSDETPDVPRTPIAGAAVRIAGGGVARQPAAWRRPRCWRLLVREMIGIANISLVFLTAVLVSAVLFGLWPSLVRLHRQHAGLQLLLPAAALHFHHRRSGKRRRAVLLCRGGGDRQQPRRAGARPGDRRPRRAPGPPRNSISSAASWRWRSPWTTCCGPPRTRSR